MATFTLSVLTDEISQDFGHACDVAAREFGLGYVELRAMHGKNIMNWDANDIAEYRSKRLAAGVSNRTVNYETGALRGILRQFGPWGPIADRVKALPERHDVGRAISAQDEKEILLAASQSRSPALLPLIVLSIDTGMRLGETQALCRKDLSLVWKDGAIRRGEVTVPKSKTAAGTGRVIPFSQRVCACLSLWLERFPAAGPDSFLFPYHKVGLAGHPPCSGSVGH